MHRWWWLLLLLPLLVTGTSSTVAEPVPLNAAPPARRYATTLWVLTISEPERQTLLANADLLGEINPFWYQLEKDGSIRGVAQNADLLAELAARGVRIVPTLANEFDALRVSAVIQDAERRALHVQELVQLVSDQGFDGIDIDYENLHAVDREAYSLFIEELATALHADGKLLSIAVHPKTNDTGEWEGPAAQDWARLGAAVDKFKIMTYDYSWSTSPAGPIAPVAWAEQVIDYAVTVVPPEKIYLGVHFYAYDWYRSTARPLTWQAIQGLLLREKAVVQRDASGEAWFTYGTGGGQRTVYFADSQSVATKLEAVFARHPGLAGIAIWRLGGEDPANWQAIRTWAYPHNPPASAP